MILILVLFGLVETVLTGKYPYTDGARLSLGDTILAMTVLGVVSQPILWPKLGILRPPSWFIVVGFITSGLGILGYIVSKHALGSHSIHPVVPPQGYVSSGIYRYLRHPMYVSFTLLVVGIALIGASMLSVVLIPATIFVYFGQKARREEALRAVVESSKDFKRS
jgi:protein-S-isoprenylcysteine O-methyltransferase Ste14